MLKHIYRTKLDIENLSLLKTNIVGSDENFNYKKIVVNKPWGYEYLMFENQYVAIWILFIKYEHSTSMHCHPNKKTSLIVLSGNIVCSTLEGWINRNEGQGLLIDEGVFHSTKAISKKGVFIMEIESPPAKHDLVRFKDEYGREKKGYEGLDKMSKDVNRYEYIDFHLNNFMKRQTKLFRKCELSICFGRKVSSIRYFLNKRSGMVCLLQGNIHDSYGNILLTTGETFLIKDLKRIFKNMVFDAIMLLGIFHYGQKI